MKDLDILQYMPLCCKIQTVTQYSNLNIIYLVFHTLQEFYTDNPKTFEDYGRIINQRHFKRVMALMEGSTVAVGGDSDESQCYIGMWCV